MSAGASSFLAAAAVLCVCAAVRELGAARAGLSLVGRIAILLQGYGWPQGGVAFGDSLNRRIVRAGLYRRVSIEAVLFAKLGGGLAGLLIGVIAAPAAPGRLSWLVLAGMPLAGFVGPDALLERRARRRRVRLVAALPDGLDLLAVSSASGRGAGTGLRDLAISSEGPLATELGMTVAELSCGAPQEEALRSLRERVPGTEMAALAAAMDRSRRYGSPLADQLRRQATSLRQDQRRMLEERAARAAPKIQLVVALVLVPSVLLMIVAGLAANADSLLGGF